MLTFTTSTCQATKGIYLNKHLANILLHPTLFDLYSLNRNPTSLILQWYHHILPQLVPAACPPTTPCTDLANYFLTTLSPHSARGGLKKQSTNITLAELYSNVHQHVSEHLHLLPSILLPQSSYPITEMSQTNPNNWIPPLTFLIAARRKLRLPVFSTGIQCTCWHTTHDSFGNHAFCCVRGNKKRAHNIISKQFAFALLSSLSPQQDTLNPRQLWKSNLTYTFNLAQLHSPSTSPSTQTQQAHTAVHSQQLAQTLTSLDPHQLHKTHHLKITSKQ